MSSRRHAKIQQHPIEEDEIERMFQRLDLNKDGVLSREDIRRSLERLKLPYTDSYVIEIQKRLDVNRDGSVSYEDFHAYVRTKYRVLHKLFDEFDVNRSGKIDICEVESMLNKMGMKHDVADVKKLMNVMGKGELGGTTINFDEWCELVMMLPIKNVEHLLESWISAAAFDLEDGVVPPPSSSDSMKTSIIHLSSGAISGAASRTGTAPFERLKVLYQVQTSKPPSIWDGFKMMYKDGGLKGLWRGNGINVAKIVPESALRWTIFEAVKQHLGSDTGGVASPVELFIAGSIAGAVSHTALYPLEVLKTRITATESNVHFTQLVRTMMREEGKFLPFFRGLGISLASVVPLSGVNLAIYESLKRLFVRDTPGAEPGVLGLLTAGSISSTVTQVLFYPMHTIKARLIIQNHGLQAVQTRTYNNTWDVVKKTIRSEGAPGLYKGFVPAMMKAIPAHVIAFIMYDKTKNALMKVSHDKAII